MRVSKDEARAFMVRDARCAGVALSFQLTFSFNSMLADEFASHLNELARADQGMLK
jgi:hypothetical protein